MIQKKTVVPTTKKEQNLGLEILDLLEQEGFEARFAGGCVRDYILGLSPVDYDIATTALPNEVLAIFAIRDPYRVIPTGLEHGTVTVVVDKIGFEITTLRQDVDTDGRHATVRFGGSFEEDAARRDFTINAMYQDKQGRIYDYFEGQEDLKRRRLRFVGDVEKRILEDHLRVLRYFRFQARFGLEGDEETRRVLTKCAPLLKDISRERISQEVKGLLDVQDIKKTWIEMSQSQILDVLFPDVFWERVDQQNTLEGLALLKGFLERFCFLSIALPGTCPESLFQAFKLPKNMLRKMQACHKGLEQWHQKEEIDVVAQLLIWDSWEKLAGPGVGELVCKVLSAQGHSQNLCVQWVQNMKTTEDTYGKRRKKSLPVDGADLIQTFSLAGARVGQALFYLRQTYYAGLWQSKKEGLECIQSWLEKQEL